jgi:hypothetical protein
VLGQDGSPLLVEFRLGDELAVEQVLERQVPRTLGREHIGLVGAESIVGNVGILRQENIFETTHRDVARNIAST